MSNLKMTRGQFHKPIYARAKLLRLKKASQKLGTERKWVYEIDPRLLYRLRSCQPTVELAVGVLEICFYN